MNLLKVALTISTTVCAFGIAVGCVKPRPEYGSSLRPVEPLPSTMDLMPRDTVLLIAMEPSLLDDIYLADLMPGDELIPDELLPDWELLDESLDEVFGQLESAYVAMRDEDGEVVIFLTGDLLDLPVETVTNLVSFAINRGFFQPCKPIRDYHTEGCEAELHVGYALSDRLMIIGEHKAARTVLRRTLSESNRGSGLPPLLQDESQTTDTYQDQVQVYIDPNLSISDERIEHLSTIVGKKMMKTVLKDVIKTAAKKAI